MISESRAAEWIEQQAWEDIYLRAPAALQSELGLAAHRIGAATALVARHADHVLLNRTLGLGMDGQADEQTVSAIVDRYRAERVPRFFVHLAADAGPDQLASWLEARGVVRYHRAWAKLARGVGPVTPASTRLTVRRATPRDAAEVAAIFELGFDLPPGAGRVFSSVLGRPSWNAYVACRDDSPVAAAVLFVRDQIANLAGAATLPSARGQGAQGALMAARIRDALDVGCRLIVAETGEAVPGDPQHSYRNMRRHGLVPVSLRDNYAPRGTGWYQDDAPMPPA